MLRLVGEARHGVRTCKSARGGNDGEVMLWL